MELQYAFLISLYILMSVVVTYIVLKVDKSNRGSFDKKDFYKTVIIGVPIILISFFAGYLIAGQGPLKFAIMLPAVLAIHLYGKYKPEFYTRYNPKFKKYVGIAMAVFMAFMITGCTSTATTTTQPPSSIQQQDNTLPERFVAPPEPIKRGQGTLRERG